ncbi:hypothetical protein BT96DRAFT_965608 [Gymnopus androsaceus JB14]|uniref:Peptidase M20 dimerisation domain-containing protein n=1 Tax=Gymnopus androsaceus JB14 TaxID=1447944 RepID=A0A6A4HNG9_9AGAR|nr:hypothetical protein BT96DRAFT_965608 [Gymnopus androsaceus JB14]
MDSDQAIISGCFGGLRLQSLFKRRSKQTVRPVPAALERNVSQPAPSMKAEKDERDFLSPSRDFSFGSPSDWWLPDESVLPPYTAGTSEGALAAEKTIESSLDELEPELRKLSMKIHAWKAEFSHGTGGKGQMDALPGIGHACGHNLIASSGCGIAVALKAALENHDIPGKIVLLGTPAEEVGGGKIILLERGGYDEMDFCVMSHPGPGPPHSFDAGNSTAVQTFKVEYLGKSAHAGASPWEGVNALDAAFMAYSGLSVLRQQMKPTYRSHGIVNGRDWISNVIPDNASLRWQVRAPSRAELIILVERVRNCFEAAALATGCTVQIDQDPPYYDVKQNPVLGQLVLSLSIDSMRYQSCYHAIPTTAKIFSEIVQTQYGHSVYTYGSSASTDFGNVSYNLPALHPMYSIPTEPNGGNHTPAFAKAAKSKEAHAATMISTRALARTALRFLENDQLFGEMKGAFESSRQLAF